MDPKYFKPTGKMIEEDDWSNYDESKMSQSDIAHYTPRRVPRSEYYSKKQTDQILNEDIHELFNTIKPQEKTGGKPSRKIKPKKTKRRKNTQKKNTKKRSRK